MDSLEKIVNTIRIAPHGIIPTAIGAGLLADFVFFPGSVEHLPTAMQYMHLSTMLFCMTWGPQFVVRGIEKYRRFKRGIEEHGFNREHVEKNLLWYCERQAYKAAAYSCGFGREFDEINHNYDGEKDYMWVPEI